MFQLKYRDRYIIKKKKKSQICDLTAFPPSSKMYMSNSQLNYHEIYRYMQSTLIVIFWVSIPQIMVVQFNRNVTRVTRTDVETGKSDILLF